MRIVVGILTLLGSLAYAATDRCPGWTKDPEVMKTVGVCPKAGEGKLLHSGDSFPELAVIVSEAGVESGIGFPSPSPRYKLGTKNPTPEEKKAAEVAEATSRNFVADTVVAALKRSERRPPLIFLPVSDATMYEIQLRVLAMTPKANQAMWQKALVQIKDVPREGEIPRSAWQQDYFKSLINEKGQAELRYLEYYGRGTEKFANQLFDKMAEACPLLKKGADIEEPPKRARRGDWQNAYLGGNIIGGPMGTCIFGDNQDEEFGKQFCPDTSKHVRLPVSWLTVGHVDEVVNIVPRPAGKAPCDFAVLLSSPKAAVKAMEADPSGKFFEFFFGPGREPRNQLVREVQDRLNSAPVRYLCDAILGHPEENPQEPLPSPKDKHSWSWFPEAWAGIGGVKSKEGAEPESDDPCLAVTNRQVLAFLKKNQEFALTQELVEKRMEEARKIFREKLPACQVEFRAVPDLFFGGHLVQKKEFKTIDTKVPLADQFDLPNGEISSLLPNAANSEVIGKSVLAPHPQNGAFRKAIDGIYSELGLSHTFIDTFDAAHVAYGNLHCATQTIRWCRPEATP